MATDTTALATKTNRIGERNILEFQGKGGNGIWLI